MTDHAFYMGQATASYKRYRALEAKARANIGNHAEFERYFAAAQAEADRLEAIRREQVIASSTDARCKWWRSQRHEWEPTSPLRVYPTRVRCVHCGAEESH